MADRWDRELASLRNLRLSLVVSGVTQDDSKSWTRMLA